jgi:hypothetical protein
MIAQAEDIEYLPIRVVVLDYFSKMNICVKKIKSVIFCAYLKTVLSFKHNQPIFLFYFFEI